MLYTPISEGLPEKLDEDTSISGDRETQVVLGASTSPVSPWFLRDTIPCPPPVFCEGGDDDWG